MRSFRANVAPRATLGEALVRAKPVLRGSLNGVSRALTQSKTLGNLTQNFLGCH